MKFSDFLKTRLLTEAPGDPAPPGGPPPPPGGGAPPGMGSPPGAPGGLPPMPGGGGPPLPPMGGPGPAGDASGTSPVMKLKSRDVWSVLEKVLGMDGK